MKIKKLSEEQVYALALLKEREAKQQDELVRIRRAILSVVEAYSFGENTNGKNVYVAQDRDGFFWLQTVEEEEPKA